MAWLQRQNIQKQVGGVPIREMEKVPSEPAQPHVEAAGSEDAPRVGRGAGPQP